VSQPLGRVVELSGVVEAEAFSSRSVLRLIAATLHM